MKPDSWQRLPIDVLSMFLDNVELEYDGYETSRADVVNAIECGADISSVNRRILDAAWARVTEDRFKEMVKSAIEALGSRLWNLKTLCGSRY